MFSVAPHGRASRGSQTIGCPSPLLILCILFMVTNCSREDHSMLSPESSSNESVSKWMVLGAPDTGKMEREREGIPGTGNSRCKLTET